MKYKVGDKLRERMEHHMSKGEYVRAVQWAELAEKAEVLENECTHKNQQP